MRLFSLVLCTTFLNLLLFEGFPPLLEKEKFPRKENLRLSLREEGGVGRQNWPITCGIPLPPGSLHSEESVFLTDEAGEAVLLQTKVLARHRDKSIRWLLVDFPGTVPAKSEKQYRLAWSQGKRKRGNLLGKEGSASLVIRTDRLRLTFCRRRRAMEGTFDSGRSRFSTFSRPWEGVLRYKGKEISTSRLENARLYFETNGPLRCCASLEGEYRSEAQGVFFHGKIKTEAFYGTSLLRIRTCWTNVGVPLFVQGLCLRFPLESSWVREALVVLGGVELSFSPLSGALSLVQDGPGHFSLTYGGKAVEEGARTDFLFGVSGPAGRLSVGVPYFAERCPSRLDLDKEAIEVSCLTGENFWPPGMAVTGECLLWMNRGQWSAGLGTQEEAAMRSPLFATLSPSEYISSENFGDLSPAPSREFPAYEEVPERIDRLFQEGREGGGWYGWRDFGDWVSSEGEWGNLEYDTALGFLLQFIRTADRRYLRRGQEMVRHWLDIDILHGVSGQETEGLPWVHGKDHRNGHEAGHVWVEGPMIYAFLTGEEEALDACRRIGNTLREHYVSREDVYKMERKAGWLLVALAVLSENFSEDSFKDAMEEAARRIMDLQGEDGGFFTLERHQEGLVRSSPWTTGGILLEGLYRYFRITGDMRAREAISRAGYWILQEGWAEGESRFYTQIVRFNPLALPVARGNLLEGSLNLFVVQSMGYAFAVSGDRRFLSAGRTIFQAGLENFLTRQNTGDGRTWSRILRGAPRFLYWLERKRAMEHRFGR